MRGVYEVGQDSCLYLEPFALRYANDHIGDPGDRAKVLAALQYYFGQRDIPDAQARGGAAAEFELGWHALRTGRR